MDTQDLKVFLAVVETGSFSLAAEKVHLTQPAVSKRIASLEAQMDTVLFDRISRTVQLTESGKQLLIQARDILNGLENLRQSIHSTTGEIAGTLTLAISHHLGLHRLPPYLQSYSTHYPKVELDVTFTDSEKAYEGVVQGLFELGAITLAPQDHPKITALKLWDDPMYFVVNESHPLAELKAHSSLKSLSQHRCLLPDLSTYTGRIVKSLFDKEKLILNPVLQTNYLETLARMTEIGLGWSVLPSTLIEDHRLVRLPLPLNLSRDLGVIRLQNRSLSRAAKAFIQLVSEND